MFAPLGALSAAGTGFLQGLREGDDDRLRRLKLQDQQYQMMGLEALGKAFQPDQGPQPPMPGQASVPAVPAAPMAPPPAQGGALNIGGMKAAAPGMQPLALSAPPGPPSGAGAPPAGVGAPPASAAAGGMPQFDLQTLAQRIAARNPNLPPQAMVAALSRAEPLLSAQGRMELARVQAGYRNDMLGLRERMVQMALQRQATAQDTKATATAQAKDDATQIADAIAGGQQPPTLQGLYGKGTAVRAALAKKGFNLSKAQQEWTAAQKQIQSLNGPQMTRYAGLAQSVVNTIDEVKSLAEELDNSGIPLVNRARLQSYSNTQGNTQNGQLAARYLAAVNTLKEEFANLAQGGYAPTESAWALANQQINGDYGVKQLGASLDEVQRLIRYRLQAIPNFQTLGPSGQNRYFGGGTGGAAGAAAPAPAEGAAPAGNGGWSVQRVQ